MIKIKYWFSGGSGEITLDEFDSLFSFLDTNPMWVTDSKNGKSTNFNNVTNIELLEGKSKG